MNITGEINVIDPRRIKLSRDSFNELRLKLDGEAEYSDVKIIRLFPISDPQHYICFKGVKIEADEKRQEHLDSQTDECMLEDGAAEKQISGKSESPKRRPKEIGIVKDIQKMDPESRKIVEEELEMIYFIPKIIRINRIRAEGGSYKWVVETDRGEREFDVRHREDIQVIESNRVMVKDVDGNRFEIPNYSRLDSRSRSILERYM